MSSTPWNWDGESRNKASSLLNAVLRFPFLITQVTAMKGVSIVKPLSIRLQKCDIHVYEAYRQVDDIKGDLKSTRVQFDNQFQQWFETADSLATKFGIEPSIPRVEGRQEQRSNAEATTPKEYYKTALAIPFLEPLSYLKGHLFQP